MRKGWDIKKLGEVAKVIYGYTEKASSEEVGPKFLRITDIQDGGVNWETVPFCKINNIDYSKYKLSNGDIVFARTGATTGKSYLISDPPKSVFASYLIKVHIYSKELLPEYLSLFFQTKTYWDSINEGISGSAQGGFNATKLSELNVPLPPLPEQERIVVILDEAITAIAKAKANAEQNRKNAKELFESYLQAVFEIKGENWEVCNLETYIKLIDYRGRTPVKTTSGVRLITAKNVKLGHLQLEPQEFIDANNYDSWMSRGIPNFGDVIFTTEAPLANVAQIDTNERLAFAQRIIVMQPQNDKIDQTFLKFMLLSNPIRNKILEQGTGATVLGIKSSRLKKVEIYFPKAIKEQQAIVRQLNTLKAETKKLESIYQQKLEDLEELKKSFFQKAFAGELAGVSAKATTTKIIVLEKIVNISATDLQAGITAIALQRHIEQDKKHSFHHVKAEKIVHLVEYIMNIDLERNPVKDAAGPNDFLHTKKVESRAIKAGFYTVVKNGDFYDYYPGSQFQNIIKKTEDVLQEKLLSLNIILDLLITMTTQQTEIVATVYAAWNNLLLTNASLSDEEIVKEARENWHKDKLKISRDKFFSALDWMKKQEILIPKGNGKKVLSK